MKDIFDRGMIKWQPFNSCFNPNDIIKDIKSNKNKIKYPALSDDQLIIIENKINEAYQVKEFIKIKYYYNGNIYNIKGIINNIDNFNKKIYLNNISIFFKQIIDIN